MRKTLLTFMALIFLSGYAHAVPFFEVIDTTYHIYGGVGVFEFPDGPFLYEEQFNRTSKHPIEDKVYVENPDGSIQSIHSIAQPGFLYSEIIDSATYIEAAYAKTEVWTETVFKPLYSGSGPILTFYHAVEYPLSNNEFIITDNSLGIEIYNPGWDIEPDPRLLSFDYDSWDMTHTYTLRMALWGSTNQLGFHEYEMGTNFPVFTSVPEPATILLLGLSLAGLAAVSRKRFNK